MPAPHPVSPALDDPEEGTEPKDAQMIETTFTPWASLGGGILIGLAATLLMLVHGRIMGATGILAGLVMPASRADFVWRAALVAGMVCGPLVLWLLAGIWPEAQVTVPLPLLLVSGVIVGIGVSYGGGCTSGHGVCGIARLSPRSIAATLTFMVTTFVTVFILRHLIGA
jgi:uncharacterized membrane protein YedE/YeeE